MIRDTTDAALAAYAELAAIHDLEEKTGADSGARYVLLAGPPAEIADRLRAFEAVGVDEVIWIFRNPFDLETIERIGEVRAALAGLIA